MIVEACLGQVGRLTLMTLRCALRETKGRSSARNACSGLLGRTRTMCFTFLRKGRDRLEYALQQAQHMPRYSNTFSFFCSNYYTLIRNNINHLHSSIIHRSQRPGSLWDSKRAAVAFSLAPARAHGRWFACQWSSPDEPAARQAVAALVPAVVDHHYHVGPLQHQHHCSSVLWCSDSLPRCSMRSP